MGIMKKTKNRKLNRLKNYNYSNEGLYFVTICIKNRHNLFGKIENNQMILNQYGKIIFQQWKWLFKRYEYVKQDEFVVMPNHVHGILIIIPGRDVIGRDVIGRDRSRPVPTNTNTNKNTNTNTNLRMQTNNLQKIKSLSELIGAFKTTSSKKIHQIGMKNFQWQRSFHDRIIRDFDSLHNIRNYIQNNPKIWFRDRNNI